MYNLQQQYIEKFLHDAVAANDLIDMRWQSELAGIELHEDSVSARITSPAGDYWLDAFYVLAADGARSPVRSHARTADEGRQLRRPVCDRGYPHGSRFSDRAPGVLRTERQSRRHGADPQAAGRYLAHRLSAPRRRKRGRSPARKKTSAPASARSWPISATPNRGNWNGGASIPPTRSASTTTGTAASSSSATPRISCRSLACAG